MPLRVNRQQVQKLLTALGYPIYPPKARIEAGRVYSQFKDSKEYKQWQQWERTHGMTTTLLFGTMQRSEPSSSE